MPLPYLLFLLLLGCQPQVRADSAGAEVTVLDVSASVYAPAVSGRSDASEAAACKAWSLDKSQVASVFGLSKPLAEGERHGYYWLPCSISGRAQVNGRIWEFEINAAGTSTWRAGSDTRQMGCSQPECEPLVLLMFDGLEG